MKSTAPIRIIALFFLLLGCQKTTDKVKSQFMPVARGEADEIILVIDSAQWEGDLGDTLKSIVKAPMAGLPQEEPLFRVSKVNPLKLNSVFKSATNMIFVMTLDNRSAQSRAIQDYFTDNSLKMIQRDTSLFMTLKRDEFAKGQLVLYLYGNTEEQLIKKIKENRERIVSLFENAARQQIRDDILENSEKQLMKSLKEDHGYEIHIPYGWKLAKNQANFTWLRLLEAESEQNIFIYYEPYRDEEVFNDIGKLRDDITAQYLRDSEKSHLHIKRQEVDFAPMVTKRVSFNGHFAVEARGLWMVSNKSAGGPFISYTFVDEPTQMLYYIEGYVYAPGGQKKNLVREVDAILSTFKAPSDLKQPAAE